MPGDNLGFNEGDKMIYCKEEFFLDEIRFNEILKENMFFFWSKNNRLFVSEKQLREILKGPRPRRKK